MAAADGKTIVVEERLNRRWAGQLVTYPFQAGPGECVPGSLSLTGPGGPQAVQCCEVETWPGGGSVKSGRVAFVVDQLAPLTSNTYTLAYGRRAAPRAASALKITADDRQVEMGVPGIAVRLPLGSRSFDPPAAADTVPGPIAGLRLGDDPWSGGSRLHGAGRVTRWSARVTDNGPVFGRVESTYAYDNGTVLKVRVQASTGENTIRVDMDVTGGQSGDGWDLDLTPKNAFADMQTIYGVGSWMRERAVAVPAEPGETPLVYLSPWAGDYWFPDSPAIIRLRRLQPGPELQLCVRDVGDWVDPQERPPWSNFATWSNAWVSPPRMWAGWQTRRIPLLAAGGSGVRMRMSLVPGRRHWSMAAAADGAAVMSTFLRKEITTHCNLPLLDEVKDMALDWPDDAPVSGGGAAEAPVVGDEILNKLGNLDLFRMNEGLRIFDRCRSLLRTQTPPAQRRLNKAQMAYLAYMAADPRHWSFERGYCSGNPNMTATRVCNIGLFGLTLQGHPKSREWFEYANQWMKYWMAETVTAKGYWPESAHYTEVSMAAMGHFAQASAGREGYRVADDPKYKALLQFYRGKVSTPDGRIVPYGRGVGSNLGGARQPDWTSEHIPHFGFILRSHAATPGENFLLYLPYRAQCADGEIWPHQVASIASWYAAGKPVAGWHPGRKTPPDWAFKPHVRIEGIATEGTPASSRVNGFALLPGADYVSASFGYAGDPAAPPWGCHCGACPGNPKPFPGKTGPYAWTTQMLLAGDEKPGGINYLVLRDTVDIDRASTWEFPAVPDALDCFVVSPAGQTAGDFRLHLAGAGTYSVALVPRSSGSVTSSVSADGGILRLSGAFGTDHVFVGAPGGGKAAEGDVAFEGTAGMVRDRGDGLVLVLPAPGSVRCRAYGVSGAVPVALRVADDRLVVSCSEPWSGGEIRIQAPGRWAPDAAPGVGVREDERGTLVLVLPAGGRRVDLRKAP